MVAPSDWVRRGRRFVGAIVAHPDPPGLAEARSVLGPAGMRLFDRMARADRWHALRVYDRVRRAGHSDPDLLRAALLHDVGKSAAKLTVWHRALVDLGETLWPSGLDLLIRRGPVGLSRTLRVARDHPTLGAREAAAVGLPPRVVSLIAGDPDPSLAGLLGVLREHDSRE
jgi:hypothetical protein